MKRYIVVLLNGISKQLKFISLLVLDHLIPGIIIAGNRNYLYKPVWTNWQSRSLEGGKFCEFESHHGHQFKSACNDAGGNKASRCGCKHISPLNRRSVDARSLPWLKVRCDTDGGRQFKSEKIKDLHSSGRYKEIRTEKCGRPPTIPHSDLVKLVDTYGFKVG